jgi:hypothetical protein
MRKGQMSIKYSTSNTSNFRGILLQWPILRRNKRYIFRQDQEGFLSGAPTIIIQLNVILF